MKTKNYKFLNLHLSLWIRSFVTAVLLGVLILSIAGLPLWIIPCVMIVVGLSVFLLTSSSITIDYGLKSSKIVIRGARESISLETPIKADVWWNYSFNSNAHRNFEENDGGTPTPARSDEINVILEIEDKTGQKVTFVERIVFDLRFPNEVDYSHESMNEFAPQFKVQRVDEIIEFLKGHL